MPEGAYCSMRHCSVPTTLPPFNLPFFSWHSFCDRKEKIRNMYFTFFPPSTRFIQQSKGLKHKLCFETRPWAQQSRTAPISRQSHHPQHDFTCLPFGWQEELHGWEIKAFGVALTQNHSVICCLLLSCRLTFYLWSKMWFYCQTQLVVSRRVLLRWEKWHLLEEGLETVMTEWQLSVSTKALRFNL